MRGGSEALFIGGGEDDVHGIFPLYSPKPTSFWCLGTLNRAVHPTTDRGDMVVVGTRRLGPFDVCGGASVPPSAPAPWLGPLKPIFCDNVDLFVSFPWTVDGPKRSPDASWVSILLELAPAARDGFGLGFGLPLLGFIVGHFDPC
jgi:hypothetical protein